MHEVSATATGTGNAFDYAVYNQAGSSPVMDHLTANASATDGYGVTNDASSPTIRNAEITGAVNSIENFSGSTAIVSDSSLGGDATGGGFTCFAVRTTAGVELGADCGSLPAASREATPVSARCAATLRWDLPMCTTTNFALPTGATTPWWMAFDGTHIWLTNRGPASVTRIDPGTGAGTNIALPAGAGGSVGIAFDGTNVWTANFGSDNVTRFVP